jgi:phosphatidate phosphatase APP1
MRDWKKVAHRVAARLDRELDDLQLSSDRVVEVHPFRGYGTADTLHVLGRVLRQPRIALAADAGTPWSNLVESFRRLASEEVVAAQVMAEVDGVTVESRTDDEGYFHVQLRNAMPAKAIHQVQVRAIAPESREAVFTEVLVPPATAQFGVISDIDDTIVETNATGLVKMARTVFMQNARGRVATPGIASLYRTLKNGKSGVDGNPFFYVSSSPWNFFDLLDQFLTLNDIPIGPLMLQDYGIDEKKLIHSPHDDHKHAQIEEIFKTYPHMPFVLVGDSGQRDPEIYDAVVKKFGARVRAVYIRDVTKRAIPEGITLFTKVEEVVIHARGLGLV